MLSPEQKIKLIIYYKKKKKITSEILIKNYPNTITTVLKKSSVVYEYK
jgi:hypothetical protein